MSLRMRILGSFVSIILITVLLTLGVAYWTTERNLRAFTEDISQFEAESLAQFLSQEYTLNNGWSTLELALFETGYLFDEFILGSEFELSEEDLDSFYYQSFSRVVVINLDQEVIIDSFGELEKGEFEPEPFGESATIIDLRTRNPVGTIFVEANADFLAEESDDFMRTTVFTSALGGLLAAILALLLGAWLSGWITTPITALTNATKAIAQQEQAELLPVKSNDELGQMSASFNRMTVAMQTQRDLRKRLIDDVSHEINTPLSVIQLEAKGLKDGLQSPGDAAQQIIHEVDMLRNLVNDLNWLAETDSGELRLNLEEGSLSQLLQNEVGRWQTQAASKNISLTVEAAAGLPSIQLDEGRMSQVMGNLIRNALQHTEAGDSITVTTKINSTPSKSNGQIQVSVIDSGTGIDPADLPHLFERFYRADQSRNRVSGGSGLGLAIAQAIVEAHGGQISIASSGLGHGTTVSFELPII